MKWKWNPQHLKLYVELSANYLVVDRANPYQTLGFLGEIQLKENLQQSMLRVLREMGFLGKIQLKENKSSRGIEANNFSYGHAKKNCKTSTDYQSLTVGK